MTVFFVVLKPTDVGPEDASLQLEGRPEEFLVGVILDKCLGIRSLLSWLYRLTKMYHM